VAERLDFGDHVDVESMRLGHKALHFAAREGMRGGELGMAAESERKALVVAEVPPDGIDAPVGQLRQEIEVELMPLGEPCRIEHEAADFEAMRSGR